jgi:TonB family protein
VAQSAYFATTRLLKHIVTKVMCGSKFLYPRAWLLPEYRVTAQRFKGGAVSFQSLHRVVALVLLVLGVWAATSVTPAWGQAEINRKMISRVVPVYPELARRMNITGVVKIEVTILPNGSVKDAKAVGGHPLFIVAALDAAKKCRFEASAVESTQIVDFHFDPSR